MCLNRVCQDPPKRAQALFPGFEFLSAFVAQGVVRAGQSSMDSVCSYKFGVILVQNASVRVGLREGAGEPSETLR
jgi:hypothetical protein